MCKALIDLENDAREEGREEGIALGKVESIIELLEEYGEVPDELRSTISEQKDLEILTKWFRIAIKKSSVQEFANSI